MRKLIHQNVSKISLKTTLEEEYQYWKNYYEKTPDIKLYNMNRKLMTSNNDNCIRCENFINSQTCFGVLCEKCNELWFKECEEKNLDPLSPNGSSKSFWNEFLGMNPSRRF